LKLIENMTYFEVLLLTLGALLCCQTGHTHMVVLVFGETEVTRRSGIRIRESAEEPVQSEWNECRYIFLGVPHKFKKNVV